MAGLEFDTVPLSELTLLTVNSFDSHLPRVALVVDDERIIADTLAEILRTRGFAAYPAYDADSALDFARVIPPEFLITDVIMPGTSGVDLAIAIRLAVPDCHILLFTGLASFADVTVSASAMGHHFEVLAKPVTPAELLAHMADLADPLLPAVYGRTR